MLKIGLIGCGSIANSHATGWLANSERARVTAVSDVVPENTARLARRLDATETYADFRELIAQADVDAVDICLPHHLHEDAIVAAAAAGKHVLCEKPLCINLDEAERIRAAVRRSGIIMMCAHNQVFDPAVQRARQMLTEGVLGEIYMARTCDCFVHPRAHENWGWRGTKETMGGGCLIDTGYHPTYLLLYLVDSEPVEVTAMTGRYRVSSIEGEDSALVLVRFANGVLGHVMTSWAWDWPGGAYQFQILGTKGQLYGRGNRIYFHPNGWQPAQLELPSRHNFTSEITHFIECVENKQTPIQTDVHGAAVLRLILGAYSAIEQRRTVDIS